MIDTTLTSLQKNGVKTYFVEDKETALTTVKSLLGDEEKTIGLGGSVTVEEVGVMDFILHDKKFEVFNQYEQGITFNENIIRRKKGLLSDIYIAGTNAITLGGQLVNADGAGNRVAAMIFGPTQVILIAGINKIVPDLAAAFDRINTIAAVKNAERVNKKAAMLFKDRQYSVKTTANYYCIIEQCSEPQRITLVLVNETLGF